MRYLSIKCVLSACNGCIDKTTNQFWGLLAILFAIDKEIEPTKTYTFIGGDVSAFLDELFSFGDKNKSDSEITWYIIFSNIWKEYMLEKCIKNKPNIYDVAIWLFRKTTFANDINADGILKMFLEKTHFKKEELDSYFNFDERELYFEDYAYNDISLIEKLKEDYQLISSNDNQTLSFEKTKAKNNDNNKVIVWSCIKYPAGNLTQAPFVQTLYSGQGIQKCILLTKFDLDSLYKRQNDKNVKDMEGLQVIYYGAPGTGKSNTIKREVDDQKKLNFRTTFHPDSDYSTFVGCYKPKMKRSTITKDGVTTTEEKIVYSFEPQAFTNAYVQAWKAKDDVYLIIEEINRGNCAQIFGDLFQLLDRKNGESEYPVDADSSLADYLQTALAESKREDIPAEVKNGTKLKLPSNLYIWATMNTSDQSLFPIDSAFKRRWEWKYMKIKNEGKEWKIDVKIKDANGEEKLVDWWGFIRKVNDIIASMTSSADKQLGYFFCKADKKTPEKASEPNSENDLISVDTFVSKVLFYLWNDVFKDYGFEDVSLFQYISKTEEGKETKKDLTFPDFYKEDSNDVNPTMVTDFVQKVMNWKKKEEEKN